MEENSTARQLVDARILVVDDDPIMRALIQRVARNFVTEIEVAADGVEGLEIWRRWRPHVIVTDILMPRMGGLEMSALIKAEAPDAQIIVITSDTDSASLRVALEVGVDRYIAKPVDMHLLADAIAKCVRDQRQIEELRMTREIALLTEELREQLHETQRAEAALQREKAEQQVLISRLEEAHNQLLQSEKMASIGQLAAGVAHEINNPIGFVNSNLGALQNYVRGLLQLIAAYSGHEGELSAAAQGEIAALKRAIDLDFIREDIGGLLAESLGGLDRVRRIVQDMKDFSHAGDAEMHWAHLEQGLESTLNVVRNEIKFKAELVRDYAPLPEVECIASQVNQVFMNLLVNAAQAISGHGSITVRTRHEGDEVSVEIADTGAGIAPEHLTRIFDPFFTTKPVGAGTGLGLSITAGIVRKHHGRVEVRSTPGIGTTFRVVLPVKQPPD